MIYRSIATSILLPFVFMCGRKLASTGAGATGTGSAAGDGYSSGSDIVGRGFGKIK